MIISRVSSGWCTALVTFNNTFHSELQYIHGDYGTSKYHLKKWVTESVTELPLWQEMRKYMMLSDLTDPGYGQHDTDPDYGQHDADPDYGQHETDPDYDQHETEIDEEKD